MGQIYIVRHGNTFDKGDVITRVGARTDLSLSVSGQAQADRLSVHFQDHEFGRAYCSPLKRTKETANTILKSHDLSPNVLEFLTEIDYGPDENMPEADVINRLGQTAIDIWDRDAVPPNGWLVDPNQIKLDWAKFLASHADYDDDTLLVTSNGIARFVLDIAAPTGKFDRKLKTGAYGVVKFQDLLPATIAWNVKPDQ